MFLIKSLILLIKGLFIAVCELVLFSIDRQLAQLQTILPEIFLKAFWTEVIILTINLEIIPEVIALGLPDLFSTVLYSLLEWRGALFFARFRENSQEKENKYEEYFHFK